MARFTDRTVKTIGPGRHAEGTVRGLYLQVQPTGARSWILRYQLNHRRTDMGLGPYPEVSLAKARELALAARRLVKVERQDPIAARNRTRVLTFKDAAEQLIASKRPGWRSASHAAQWPATLACYAYPQLANLDVKTIDTRAVLDVLRPIWSEKTETASRLRQRIEAVLDYAASLGVRSGENPARWRGHLDNLLPKPSKVRAVEHHAALEWQKLPEFMAELATRDGIAAKALAFTILTAARSGEVRGMRWGEVDLASSVWTVPASRIKAGKEHRVPLVPAAIALLGPGREPHELVFPSPVKATQPITGVTLIALLHRLNRPDLTVHGFRSTFRDWAGEVTHHPREVIEAALAHRLKDRAEAAYARGDLFTKRRKLMADWADFAAARASAD